MKAILKALKEHVHELGAVYYGWAIISAISGVLYSAYKSIVTPEIAGLSGAFFYLFVITVVIIITQIPILVLMIGRILKESDHKIANKTLAITNKEIACDIAPDGLQKIMKLTLRAVDDTKLYKFRFRVSGSGSIQVKLLSSGAKLMGPVPNGNGYESYQIEFDHILKVGEVISVTYQINITDPSKTMKHFIADSFTNAAAYGSFKGIYNFSTAPQQVLKEVVSCITGESSEPIEMLCPAGPARYELNIPQVKENMSYTVSWVW